MDRFETQFEDLDVATGILRERYLLCYSSGDATGGCRQAHEPSR